MSFQKPVVMVWELFPHPVIPHASILHATRASRIQQGATRIVSQMFGRFR